MSRSHQLPLAEPAALVSAHPRGKVATSAEAFDRIDGDVRRTGQERVLDLVTYRGSEGATCDEVCVSLDMPVQTATARCNDLARAGLIYRDGTRRLTRSGHGAFVWRATANKGSG